MRVLLISLALAGALATDPVASTAKDYITSRIAAGCPATLAPSVATDVRALPGSNRYEITFDGATTFHVRLDAAGAVAKCVPDPCADHRKHLAVTLAKVDAINKQGLSWKAAFGPDDVERAAEAFGMGHISPPPRDQKILKPLQPARRMLSTSVPTPSAPLPPVAYDARDTRPGQTPCKAFGVLEQGYCGCCYAFASAVSFSARMCRANPMGNVQLSPEQLMDCSDGCGGGTINDALNVLIGTGGVEAWCDPFTAGGGTSTGTCGGTCSTGLRYAAIAGSVVSIGGAGVLGVQQMQYELIKSGPGAVGFSAMSDIYAYASGIYTPSSAATYLGGHAVSLIGWGVDNGIPYWLCQNSWGTTWGEKGFFRILRGNNTCGIESTTGLVVAQPVVPTACPNSNCFNGSVTLADCTCRCDNGLTGADCSVCARVCQHGGQLDPQACQCICPLGYSGANCEIGYATTPLATCTGGAVTVTYTGTSIQQGSFVGIYALSQTNPFNSVASTQICGAYTTPGVLCPANGALTIPIPTALGRYKIAVAVDVAGKGFYALQDSATIGYVSVLAANCLASDLAAARATNSPINPITATLAAQQAQQAIMTARLDAAAPVLDAMIAAGPFSAWVSDVPNPNAPVLWLGTTRAFCYSIPSYLNNNPKALTLYIGPTTGGSYYPNQLGPAALQLPADAQACINITLPTGVAANTQYTISMDGPAGFIGQYTFTAGKATTTYSSMGGIGNTVTIKFAYAIDAAHASAADVIRLITPAGQVLATLNTNAKTSGSFTYTVPRTLKGGFKPLMFPGNGTLPGYITNPAAAAWSAYGM